ncbi:LDH2 family malate/lactate/ureidoglycolate dehydrogenase [Bradyrhizobium sp. LM6.9]
MFSLIGLSDRPGATMVTQLSEAQLRGVSMRMCWPSIWNESELPACAAAVEARKRAAAAMVSLFMTTSEKCVVPTGLKSPVDEACFDPTPGRSSVL